MPVTLNATPGDPTANSYETVVEAQAYLDTRGAMPDWAGLASQEAQLIFATRVLDMMYRPHRALVPAQGTATAYYLTRPQWTGFPSTTTQRLAWPRTGMLDGNGNAIDPTIIPQDLKDALAELAAQLAKGDRTLDNDVIVQGLTSVRAGSVSLSFKQNFMPQVIPDAVVNLMPPSWFTDEIIEPALQAIFEIGCRPDSFGGGGRW